MYFLKEFKEHLSNKINIPYELVDKHINISQQRFSSSWNSGEYGKFSDDFYTATSWTSLTSANKSSFCKDGIDFIQLYQNSQYIDIMRMLSYSEPHSLTSLTNKAMKQLVAPFVKILVSKFETSGDKIVLVDYGCGLAYWTIHIAEILVSKNIPCELVLIDIYRESFIDFIDLIIPPFTHVIIDGKAQAGTPEFSCVLIGDVYGMTETGYQ